MASVLSALVPVFLLIALGWAMRRSGFVPEAFWPPAEKITYYVFFPALVVHSTAKADVAGLSVLPMAAGMAAAILLTVGLAVPLKRLFRSEGPAFTSLLQGAIRPNTYIAIAAIVAAFGQPGLTLAAVCIVTVVPLVNVVSVLFLLHYAGGGATPQGGLRRLVQPLAGNPLILACLAGGLLNATGASLPGPIGTVVDLLGRASLPFGLLAVGAGLDLRAARTAHAPVAAVAGLKLAAIPALTWLCCRAFGVDGLTAAVATLYAAVPTAPNSYILARQMGGDAPLMAGIVTVTTLAAATTMPVVLALL
ncbi:MAG: AEC family transporter [Magnetospirillum sp. WYHS-4]